MKKERIVYLDLLRIGSILSMICIHVSGSMWAVVPVTSFEWQVFNIYDSLSRFCVPIFIMISGALFLDPKKKITLKRLANHNICKILIAHIFWSTCYSCYNIVDKILSGYCTLDGKLIKEFIMGIIFGYSHMWFLFTIVGLYLMIPFFRKIAEEKKLCEYYIVLSFIFCYLVNLVSLIPKIKIYLGMLMEKLNINFVLGYSGYFILGYYMHNYEIKSPYRKLVYSLGVLSVMATIAGSSFLSMRTMFATESLYDYLLPNTFFASAAIFLCFKSHFSNIVFDYKYKSIILKLSSLTFGIYLVHEFLNLTLQKIGVSTMSFNPIFSVPILSLTVFFGSALITLAISKIPILNKYII